MSELRKAAEAALEALENLSFVCEKLCPDVVVPRQEIDALRAALAEEQPEPIGWVVQTGGTPILFWKKPPVEEWPTVEPVFTAPPAPVPQGEHDPADIIAGALQTSRGHAYQLMRAALAQPQGEPAGWAVTYDGKRVRHFFHEDMLAEQARVAALEKRVLEQEALIELLRKPPMVVNPGPVQQWAPYPQPGWVSPQPWPYDITCEVKP